MTWIPVSFSVQLFTSTHVKRRPRVSKCNFRFRYFNRGHLDPPQSGGGVAARGTRECRFEWRCVRGNRLLKTSSRDQSTDEYEIQQPLLIWHLLGVRLLTSPIVAVAHWQTFGANPVVTASYPYRVRRNNWSEGLCSFIIALLFARRDASYRVLHRPRGCQTKPAPLRRAEQNIIVSTTLKTAFVRLLWALFRSHVH